MSKEFKQDICLLAIVMVAFALVLFEMLYPVSEPEIDSRKSNQESSVEYYLFNNEVSEDAFAQYFLGADYWNN